MNDCHLILDQAQTLPVSSQYYTSPSQINNGNLQGWPNTNLTSFRPTETTTDQSNSCIPAQKKLFKKHLNTYISVSLISRIVTTPLSGLFSLSY